MSKKINVISNNIRPKLHNLFCKYLHSKGEKESDDESRYWKRLMYGYWDDDEWDDDDDDDFDDVVYPIDEWDNYYNQLEREESFSNGKKKHKKRKKKSSRARVVDFNDYDSNDDYSSDDYYSSFYDDNVIKIIFYNDYHNEFDSFEFNSLKEFNDFCAKNGYYVPPEVEEDILYRKECHCCINPRSERLGSLEVIGESSYSNMYYVACEPEELE